jgi:hypothetical protein
MSTIQLVGCLSVLILVLVMCDVYRYSTSSGTPEEYRIELKRFQVGQTPGFYCTNFQILTKKLVDLDLRLD